MIAPASMSATLASLTGRSGNSSGNQGQRGSGRFTDSQCQVTGLASHGHDKKPVHGRARIFENALDRICTQVTCCLKAECRHHVRKIEVVIDRFGNMDDPQASLCRTFEGESRKTGVISANGNQAGYAKLLKAFQGLGKVRGILATTIMAIRPMGNFSAQSSRWLGSGCIYRFDRTPSAQIKGACRTKVTTIPKLCAERESNMNGLLHALVILIVFTSAFLYRTSANGSSTGSTDIIWYNQYRKEVEVTEKTPEALVSGWNKALRIILTDLEDDMNKAWRQR